MGAMLMSTFGIARGFRFVVTGTLAEKVSRLQQTSTFIRWVERIGGGLMLAAAVYLLYQTAWYAGWLSS